MTLKLVRKEIRLFGFKLNRPRYRKEIRLFGFQLWFWLILPTDDPLHYRLRMDIFKESKTLISTHITWDRYNRASFVIAFGEAYKQNIGRQLKALEKEQI